MKALNSKFSKAFIGLAVLSSAFAGAIANDAVLNSDPIDINGYVQEAPATDHELETVKNELRKQKQAIQVNKEKSKKYEELGKTTEKLADVTEDMISERKESQQTIDKYNKKIECLMQENPGKDCDEFVKRKSDTVSLGMAAPMKVEATVAKDDSLEDKAIKMLPYAGMTSMQSENERLEASISAGLRAESDITSRFSVGLGFNYTTMKTTDFANGYASYLGDFYRNYTQFYGAGREIEYKNLNFDIYSKFFITKTKRFRPYVGIGVAYNRTNMRYTDNRNYNDTYGPNVYNFGDEEVTANYISGRIMGGSEIVFTKNFGINLELQYSRGLGSNFGTQQAAVQSPDQRRLFSFSEEIAAANTFSMFAGVLVLF